MRTYVTDMPNGDQPGGRPHLCTQTYVRSANLLTQADAHVRTFGGVATGERERVGESLTIIINDDDSSSPSSSYVFRRFWSSHLVL